MLRPLLDASSYLDLSVLEAGKEACIAEKTVEFTPKRYPLLHYVYAGRGTFNANGKRYNLKAGDCFYIPAGSTASYQAESENPWSYFWIGLGGSRAESLLSLAGLDEAHPVGTDTTKAWRHHFEKIYDSYFLHGGFGLDCLVEAYGLLYEMTENVKTETPLAKDKGHIQAAKAFIRNNYQFHISILDVASSVGVSPNYLANLFKMEGEISPKSYLTKVRMEAAGNLLANTSTSVSDIARAVGYANPLHFSKAFHLYYGMSPMNYRLEQGGHQ